MSESTPHSSNPTCELALDYVYGELDEARKRTFEEHLPTCARCQAEVASFGRVRAATKRVMPASEPTAPLTGALHAQLMHAAAQRKPKRGVLLSFPRRIVEHPALAAAAMFVIVGGAIAINWSRGKMAMPATETASATTTENAKQAAAPAAPAAEPEVAEPMPAAKDKEEAGKGGFAAVEKDAPKIALETPQGPMKVTRSPTVRRSAAKSEAAPPKMKNIVLDGKTSGAKYDKVVADDIAAARDESEGVAINGLPGGVMGGAGAGSAATGSMAKSSAPGDVYAAHAGEKENKPAKPAPAPAQTRGYATVAPSTTPPQAAAAPPPPAMAAPSTLATNQQQLQRPTVAKPSAGRSFDGVRKQADEYASTNRCAEAIKLYQELEKSGQYLSPTERVKWVRCLTQNGRQEEAQQRLDELKQEKRVTNAQIQDAERELTDSRRRVETKKAKKAPAADRAAPTAAEQRVAEPPPAEPAPPDSTHTKVKGTQPARSY